MRYSFILILLLIPLMSMAQRKKKRVSYAEGTLYGSYGYNWTSYSKSNLRLQGNGYDFTLLGLRAHDLPESYNPLTIFDQSKTSVPQFNARLGYYFWNHWAISVGVDHLRYIQSHGTPVRISGNIDPGIDANFSGTYDGEEISPEGDQIHYANSNGLNFLRLGVNHTNMLLRSDDDSRFVLTYNLGLDVGGLFTNNDFTFQDLTSERTSSMSGYGISMNAGLRFEFFRYFFIQPSFAGGVQHQLHVQTRPNNPYSFAKQAYLYGEFNTVLGFFIYVRPANGCNSCPVWH